MTKDKKNGKSEVVVSISYDKDSKRFHRYSIGEQGEAIVGNLYMSKEMKNLPKRIILEIDDD
jgi:hypothetical protein